MIYTKSTNFIRLFSPLLLALSAMNFCEQSQAQWVAYTFNPRAAYLSSYGLNTNTNNASTNISENGWGAGFNNNALAISNTNSWTNANTRAVYVVYFSTSATNTNTPNYITTLPPLFYTYSTNTGTLATNSTNSSNCYVTNLPFLVFTNTNVTSYDVTKNTNVWYYNRTKFSNTFYMAGQFAFSSSNTNSVGSFNSICVSYSSTNIGTNNWWANTNYTNYVPFTGFFGGTNVNPLPAVIQLKISCQSLGISTNSLNATNQQLILPMTIALDLTKTLNNNIATNSTNDPNYLALMYATNLTAVSNSLPLLIRSNGTYKTTTN